MFVIPYHRIWSGICPDRVANWSCNFDQIMTILDNSFKKYGFYVDLYEDGIFIYHMSTNSLAELLIYITKFGDVHVVCLNKQFACRRQQDHYQSGQIDWYHDIVDSISHGFDNLDTVSQGTLPQDYDLFTF